MTVGVGLTQNASFKVSETGPTVVFESVNPLFPGKITSKDDKVVIAHEGNFEWAREEVRCPG